MNTDKILPQHDLDAQKQGRASITDAGRKALSSCSRDEPCNAWDSCETCFVSGVLNRDEAASLLDVLRTYDEDWYSTAARSAYLKLQSLARVSK